MAACTAVVDGPAVYACLLLAMDCEGREIETIAGLAGDGRAGEGRRTSRRAER